MGIMFLLLTEFSSRSMNIPWARSMKVSVLYFIINDEKQSWPTRVLLPSTLARCQCVRVSRGDASRGARISSSLTQQPTKLRPLGRDTNFLWENFSPSGVHRRAVLQFRKGSSGVIFIRLPRVIWGEALRWAGVQRTASLSYTRANVRKDTRAYGCGWESSPRQVARLCRTWGWDRETVDESLNPEICICKLFFIHDPRVDPSLECFQQTLVRVEPSAGFRVFGLTFSFPLFVVIRVNWTAIERNWKEQMYTFSPVVPRYRNKVR